MGVVLYKIGGTHTIKGITCEMKVFPSHGFTVALNSDEGWKLSPEELYLKVNSEEKPLKKTISRRKGRKPKCQKKLT